MEKIESQDQFFELAKKHPYGIVERKTDKGTKLHYASCSSFHTGPTSITMFNTNHNLSLNFYTENDQVPTGIWCKRCKNIKNSSS